MGSDARRLAALLQAKAPKGHMLAYINPREAALLKEHGGSGEPHADTGIPSFDDGMDTGGFEGLTQGQVDTAAQQEQAAPISGGGLTVPSNFGLSGFSASQPSVSTPGLDIGSGAQTLAAPSPSAIQTPSLPPAPGYDITSSMGAAPEAPTPEKPGVGGMSKDTLARLGLAGLDDLRRLRGREGPRHLSARARHARRGAAAILHGGQQRAQRHSSGDGTRRYRRACSVSAAVGTRTCRPRRTLRRTGRHHRATSLAGALEQLVPTPAAVPPPTHSRW